MCTYIPHSAITSLAPPIYTKVQLSVIISLKGYVWLFSNQEAIQGVDEGLKSEGCLKAFCFWCCTSSNMTDSFSHYLIPYIVLVGRKIESSVSTCTDIIIEQKHTDKC